MIQTHIGSSGPWGMSQEHKETGWSGIRRQSLADLDWKLIDNFSKQGKSPETFNYDHNLFLGRLI